MRLHGGRLRPFINLVAVLVAYFAVPVDAEQSTVRLAVGLVLTLGSIAVIGVVVVHESRAQQSGTGLLTASQLLVLFEVVLIVFALTYFNVAVHASHQMVGIETRIDALYFATTTMATVGYGDVHPVGQAARAVTTVNLAFDIVFVAAFAHLITSRLGGREDPKT